ncbi:MBL fold metallo-hydrolase [Bacillus carboniphilus]|uniref:MBL fold metallo-hydrolase n=1 Tax=Bacillus carboniphilus TaxID=86663 RepID=A0ABY9K075_9BACI|nr:MBL fold metallo-hydrolase [Bacillus carboniphilus]WLR44222.1 MBL fold metallo-hydrolase [Bacillus carboniphilus]
MKVTVIGFWGGYPNKGEASSGYLIESANFKLLVDCGSAVLSQLQKYIAIVEIDAVILSHYHHDHIADIGPLQYARLIQQSEVNKILPIYGHPFNQEKFQCLSYKDVTCGTAYQPNRLLTVGPFSISFLQTDHPVDCYAMRISDGNATIVYTADSSFKEDFIPFAKEADLLLSECNLYADQNGAPIGHMTSTEAANIAQKAKVKELWLTHLPHSGDLNQLIEEAKTVYDGAVSLAEEGKTTQIN